MAGTCKLPQSSGTCATRGIDHLLCHDWLSDGCWIVEWSKNVSGLWHTPYIFVLTHDELVSGIVEEILLEFSVRDNISGVKVPRIRRTDRWECSKAAGSPAQLFELFIYTTRTGCVFMMSKDWDTSNARIVPLTVACPEARRWTKACVLGTVDMWSCDELDDGPFT